MNIRLFFLKQDGWFEAELSEKLLHATGEDRIRWAYAMMEQNHYRNYRIRESIHPLSSREFGTGEEKMQKGFLKAGLSAPEMKKVCPPSQQTDVYYNL
jgi:hypothetical protein